MIVGYNYVSSLDMTEDKKIPRTIKERYLSYPWKPWIKTKIIKVPSQSVLVDRKHHLIIYHPAIESRIKRFSNYL